MVTCQQQNIFKIRDRISGHGPQPVLFYYRPLYSGPKHVKLACGCSLPVPWLPKKEQRLLRRDYDCPRIDN